MNSSNNGEWTGNQGQEDVVDAELDERDPRRCSATNRLPETQPPRNTGASNKGAVELE